MESLAKRSKLQLKNISKPFRIAFSKDHNFCPPMFLYNRNKDGRRFTIIYYKGSVL